MRFAPIPGWPGYLASDDGRIWSQKRREPVPGKGGSRVVIDSRLCKELTRFDRNASVLGSRRHTWRGELREGYLSVQLSDRKRRKLEYVHALVMLAFVGPRPTGLEVLHGPDNDRSNNALSNLRYGTKLENMADRDADGNTLRGEEHPRAKHSVETILEVKQRLADGEAIVSIADELGINSGTVWMIDNGRQWTHVGEAGAS